MRFFSFLVCCSMIFGFCFSAGAETGVSEDEILLGQVCAMSGPSEALGKNMKIGLQTYFNYINDQGGVNGRKIRLISYDDGYEPLVCIDQTKQLIDEGVFALLGYVGTPTAKAAVPIAETAGVPFIGPFTGAEFLRNPVKHYVINCRASYFDETEAIIKHLAEDQGVTRIACFYQNDSYGQAGLEGVNRALKKREMALVAEGTYERNTLAVKGALARIRSADPEAVVMIGAYAPCSEFIKLAKKIGMGEVKFWNISFVGTKALQKDLAEAGEGVIISQVWCVGYTKPDLRAEYERLLKEYFPEEEVGFVSYEGFGVAKFFVEALKASGSDLTREGLITTIENHGEFDLGGIFFNYSPADHGGTQQVWSAILTKDGIAPYKYLTEDDSMNKN